MRALLSGAVAVLSGVALTACGVDVTDETPSALTRNSTGAYQVSATVVPSGSVTVTDVTAVVNGSRYPLAPGAGHEWSGLVGVSSCHAGFELVYEARWDAPLGSGTATEPSTGGFQKWVTGSPPSACPGTFGTTFAVDSASDSPDTNPGDGACATSAETCTLRAAVMEANASSGTDRILVPAGNYDLDRQGDDDTAERGDLDVLESATIEATGDGQVVIDGSALEDRIFDIFGGDQDVVTLRGLLVRGGNAPGAGGGIFNRGVLFLERMRLEDNRSGSSSAGGGIYNEGSLYIDETRIRGNTAGHFGGGLAMPESGSAVVISSAITNNHNRTQHGGGIALLSGTLEAMNVTISGNTTNVHGGGIYANSGSEVTLVNVTIARNQADTDQSGGGDGGGFLFAASERPYRISNSIVAENSKGTITVADDCRGTVVSFGHNLIEETASCTVQGVTQGNITGMNKAALFDLGFSGSNTRVHRLRAVSQARDGGSGLAPNNASILACRQTDQRGTARPIDGGGGPDAVCDVGAVEMR